MTLKSPDLIDTNYNDTFNLGNNVRLPQPQPQIDIGSTDGGFLKSTGNFIADNEATIGGGIMTAGSILSSGIQHKAQQDILDAEYKAKMEMSNEDFLYNQDLLAYTDNITTRKADFDQMKITFAKRFDSVSSQLKDKMTEYYLMKHYSDMNKSTLKANEQVKKMKGGL